MEELDRGSWQFFLYTVVVTLPWMNFPAVVDFTKTDGRVFTLAHVFLCTQHWIFRNEMLYNLIKSRAKNSNSRDCSYSPKRLYLLIIIPETTL